MERPIPDLGFEVKQIPLGPAYNAGELHDISAGMRTYRPVIHTDKCVNCLRCFLLCPDGAIDKSGEHPEVDYNYCKGCGVCARACKPGAITMEQEVQA